VPERMPPEDCLWAKPWNGRTILSAGRRFRAALTQAYMPPKSPEEPPTDSHFRLRGRRVLVSYPYADFPRVWMIRVFSWTVSSRFGPDFLTSWRIELGRCAFQKFACRGFSRLKNAHSVVPNL